MELIIVIVLFAILVPSSVGIFIGARKISGQGYVQHLAAVTLGETSDILRYMRNQGFTLLVNGSFYLIRNPGTETWLIKSDLPDKDIFENAMVLEADWGLGRNSLNMIYMTTACTNLASKRSVENAYTTAKTHSIKHLGNNQKT